MNKFYLFCTIVILSFFNSIFPQVNTERFREDEDSVGFSGYIDLEGILATGNTDFQLISLGSRLNYNWGDDYTFIIADGGYGWENGNAFVDQIFAHLRHVITTGNLLQIEMFTQFDNNKKRLLLARKLLGGGLRFRILKTDHFKFRLGTAYMFETERYDLPVNSVHPQTTSLHRFTSYVTFKYQLNKLLSFISTTYYQPRFKDFNDYKLFSENAFLIDTGKVLDLFIKFNLRYDSRPPDTVKKFDTFSRIGFSFKFGNG
jgi:hypothetical protein